MVGWTQYSTHWFIEYKTRIKKKHRNLCSGWWWWHSLCFFCRNVETASDTTVATHTWCRYILFSLIDFPDVNFPCRYFMLVAVAFIIFIKFNKDKLIQIYCVFGNFWVRVHFSSGKAVNLLIILFHPSTSFMREGSDVERDEGLEFCFSILNIFLLKQQFPIGTMH